MQEIREYIKKNRAEEVSSEISEITNMLKQEGLSVEFGNIGKKTTYALIYSEDHETEYVGYTFIMNLKYYNENIGRLKALQQAMARKETLIQE